MSAVPRPERSAQKNEQATGPPSAVAIPPENANDARIDARSRSNGGSTCDFLDFRPAGWHPFENSLQAYF
jgi:hypothetical protein